MSISFSNNGRKSFSGKEVQIQYAALDIYWNIFSNNGRKSFSGKEVQIQYAALDIYWNIFSSTATEFYDEDPQVVAFMMNTFFKILIVKLS